MARSEYGAGLADFVVTPADGVWRVAPAAVITFWDAATSGTQYTDLLDIASLPITQVTADGDGFIPRFSGPDGVTGMWADAGGTSRAWIEAHGASTGGGGSAAYTSLVRVVASATAPADVRAAASYVCDGTADQVEIQAAIAAAQNAGGGIVQLSGGGFNLTAPIEINGTANEDNPLTVTLLGCGEHATVLRPAINITAAITLSNWAQCHLASFGIEIMGSTSGIVATAVTTGGDSRSFWDSTFRDLRIYGFYEAAYTGWALDMAMPFRSSFSNIEVEGTRNGVHFLNNSSLQNAGDCTVDRMFIDLVGDNGVAVHVESTNGQFNQVNWSMLEAFAGGTGCTGILINGAAGGVSQRFWGTNLEQFDTLVNVAVGESNVFDLNFVTCRDDGLANKAFVCGTASWNNRFSAKWVNVAGGDSLTLIEDANTTAAAPNVFDGIRIEANTGSTTTYTKVASTVLRNIVAIDTGTVQAGLLRPATLGIPDQVVKAGDTNRASTITPAADPDLTRAVEANATYDVEAIAVWTNGGGGWRASWSAPVSSSMTWTDNDGVGVVGPSGVVTFSGTTGTTLKGTLVTGATAGSLTLLWAQNTTNASATILRAGCALKLVRTA